LPAVSGESGSAPSGANGGAQVTTGVEARAGVEPRAAAARAVGGAARSVGGDPGVDGERPAAGSRPDDGVRATSFLERALLRRRLSFLVRRRELALHDLGGFVFESHRLGSSRPEVESHKLAALAAIDAEVATLQHALGRREELTVLHEPGISSCPRCRAIHDSTANFCPQCGRPTADGAP
jgi:hypothetical protein